MKSESTLRIRIRKLGFIGLFALISAGCGGGGGGSAAGTDASSSGSSSSAGSYILYVPSNFKPNQSALVLALHGLNGTPEGMQNMTQLNVKAAQEGFAVAYPSAGGVVMSAGTWSWFFRSDKHVTYLREVIQSLQTSLKPDPKKIYVVGISDGGLMAHRVGVQLGDVVAAVGVVGGSLWENHDVNATVPPVPSAVAPVSVIMLHGDLDLDANAGYCGKRTILPTQDVVFNYWVGAGGNNCANLDTSAPLCIGTTPNPAVHSKKGSSCKGGVEVQFHKMIGAIHTWHGVAGNWSVPMNNSAVLPYNPNFNASTGVTTNDLLWNFFAAHPKP